MKKYLVTLLLIVTTLTWSQTKDTYSIGFLFDNQSPELTPLLLKLQNEIKSVVGEDAIISFPDSSSLVNNYNIKKATLNYEKLSNDNTDIIIAFGVVNNEVITKLKVYNKPTILFGAVNKDFNGIDLSKKSSGIENFTYLIESESFLDDVRIFKELTQFKTLGIAIESPLVDLLPFKETFDKEFKTLDANYKLIPFNTASDISSKLEGIDAIYMAGGFFLSDADIRSLAQIFVKKQLPSFTSLGVDHVQKGLMATNQSNENFDQFIRRIALSVEGYVNGTPLSEMPVFIEYSPRLTINYNIAEQVKVPIKYSLINNTDFVGDAKNAIAEKNYNLLGVIDEVLNKNLSLLSDKKNVELSMQDVKTAKSNYLPSLTASGSGTYIDPDQAEISSGQNPEFSTSGNLTLNQTIFSESANANISIQKSLQKAQEETFNASQLDAIFNASNAYFNALILKANTQIQLQNLNLTKRNLQIAEQNFEAGQSGKTDVLRFRSEMAQNTQAMVEAINSLEQGFINLNLLLNNPVETEIDIENVELDKGTFEQYNYEELTNLLDNPKLREPFIAFLVQEAKKNAPELKSLGYNLDATNRQVKLYGSGRFLPTIGVQGQYNRTFSRSGVGSTAPQGLTLLDDNYNVGVNVSIPIFNQDLNNINKKTAIIQKDQLNINKENTELSIAANVRSGVLNLINQVSNIELSKVSEETAKESLDLTQAAYSSGSVNIIQLLDAQNNFLNTQIARINAVYNFLINALELERNLGYYFLLNSEDENTKFRQRFFEFLNTKN